MSPQPRAASSLPLPRLSPALGSSSGTAAASAASHLSPVTPRRGTNAGCTCEERRRKVRAAPERPAGSLGRPGSSAGPYLAASGATLQHLPVLAPAGDRRGATLFLRRADAEVGREERGRELHGRGTGHGGSTRPGTPWGWRRHREWRHRRAAAAAHQSAPGSSAGQSAAGSIATRGATAPWRLEDKNVRLGGGPGRDWDGNGNGRGKRWDRDGNGTGTETGGGSRGTRTGLGGCPGREQCYRAGPGPALENH